MNSWWDKLWFWVTLGLGGIALLTMLAFVLPVLLFLAIPFVLLGILGWLLGGWRSFRRGETHYDETGARYTEATIISKETITPGLEEKEDGQDNQSSF